MSQLYVDALPNSIVVKHTFNWRYQGLARNGNKIAAQGPPYPNHINA
jgi:hypothetical protein